MNHLREMSGSANNGSLNAGSVLPDLIVPVLLVALLIVRHRLAGGGRRRGGGARRAEPEVPQLRARRRRQSVPRLCDARLARGHPHST